MPSLSGVSTVVIIASVFGIPVIQPLCATRFKNDASDPGERSAFNYDVLKDDDDGAGDDGELWHPDGVELEFDDYSIDSDEIFGLGKYLNGLQS